MKRMILILSIAAFISGCATAYRTSKYGGCKVYVINCSGDFRDWEMCYEKAEALCALKGYRIVEGGRPSFGWGMLELGLGRPIERKMVIDCGCR